MHRIPSGLLAAHAPAGEDSAAVRLRVVAARERQVARAGKPNALLGQSELARHCRLHPDDQHLLEQAVDRMHLSARGVHRILRVARSIADLSGRPDIETGHLAEAIGYRTLEARAPVPPIAA